MITSKQKNVQPIPKDYTTVTLWIISASSAKLIDFLKAAFDAEEVEKSRVYNEDGTIGHVEVRMGTAIVMLFDAKEGWPPTPAFARLFVEDGDAMYQKALKAGARSVTKMTRLFFGDLVGRVCDPFGNIWWIQEHVEDIDPTEFEKRAQTPASIEAMKYVQASLDRELGGKITQV